jgi:hypothetical protein
MLAVTGILRRDDGGGELPERGPSTSHRVDATHSAVLKCTFTRA